MSDEPAKPVSFVLVSGSPKSKQQKRSQYASIQSHLAKFGHLKRKHKAKKELQANPHSQPVFSSSSRALVRHRPSHSKLPISQQLFYNSYDPVNAEELAEKDEQAMEVVQNRDLERYGYMQLVRAAYWRSRTQYFADVAFIGRANTDPFYSFARTDPVDVFTGTDYFWTATVPSCTSLAHVFQFENHWGACLSTSIREPMYWYSSTAIIAITRESMTTSHIKASPQILQYIGLTYQALRERLKQPGAFSDNISITVTAYLIGLSYLLEDDITCQVHRRNLRRMVDHRGGLDALGVGGTVRNIVLDYDTYWGFEAGESLFPEARPTIEPTFVKDILFGKARKLLEQLPPGFRELTESSTISVEVSQNIVRLANASDLDALLRKTSLDNDAPLKKDLFASCPALCWIKDCTSLLDLEAALSLALVLYHCRIIMKGHTVFGKFISVRKRLTTGLQTPTSQMLQAEKECWQWIWMMAIESWRTSHGVLEHEGEMLLQRAYLQRMEANDDAAETRLQHTARQFLWTEALSQSFSQSWRDREQRNAVRVIGAPSTQHFAAINESSEPSFNIHGPIHGVDDLDDLQLYSDVPKDDITVDPDMLSYAVDTDPEQMQVIIRSQLGRFEKL